MAMVYIPTRDIEHLVRLMKELDALEDTIPKSTDEYKDYTSKVHKATQKLNMAYRHIGQNVGKQFYETKYITMSEAKGMRDE